MKTAPNSIDLQLIMDNAEIDLKLAGEICRRLFKYRRVHEWPPTVIKGDTWETAYNGQRRDLPVLPTVDEAIRWTNDLIKKIDAAE